MAELTDSIRVLPGIGPKKAALFASLGISTLYDLISLFPRTYEDRTKRCTIAALHPGMPACFEAMVISEPRTAHIRKGLTITHVRVADEMSTLMLTFYNQAYLVKQLVYGAQYLFYGTPEGELTVKGMRNPSFEPLERAGGTTCRILPVYPLTAGISAAAMRNAVWAALACVGGAVPETLPQQLLRQYGLCALSDAYREIHQPTSWDALCSAQRRLSFEEFYLFSCRLLLLRNRRQAVCRPPMQHTDLTAFFAALPFRPTGAQRRAITEIQSDLAGAAPMNRMLQGDVGSGKTLVAAAAMVCAVQSGFQAALMAPTEILAKQHFETLSAMLEPLRISCVLLTGSMRTTEKRNAKEAIADGQAQVIIGTHALFSEDVVYQDLGLIITDEQHRFGVGQRNALAKKGTNPHILVMSATPIPRTLSLILYGDLDVSILDEKPAGRQNIDTFLLGEGMRARINAFLRKQVAAGRQVYVVCPAVEEQEDSNLKSAESWAETLQRKIFPELRIALLHGQMPGAEKDRVMAAFAAGEFDVLVATTVVEVGVDVPNATLMIIENAERFGLSQLHQLRGRVGRSSEKSYCVLFTQETGEESLRRLRLFCKTTDGFRIAEEDLALRGPGDFLGTRQSGLPTFRAATLTDDLSVMKDARQAAETYLEQVRYRPPDALLSRISACFPGYSSLN